MTKYFSEAGTKSQVLKVLALLVESGSVYCALMVPTTVPSFLTCPLIVVDRPDIHHRLLFQGEVGAVPGEQ